MYCTLWRLLCTWSGIFRGIFHKVHAGAGQGRDAGTTRKFYTPLTLHHSVSFTNELQATVENATDLFLLRSRTALPFSASFSARSGLSIARLRRLDCQNMRIRAHFSGVEIRNPDN